MKKIFKILGIFIIFIFSIVWFAIWATVALIIIAVVFIELGKLGDWYFNVSILGRVLSSISIAVIFLIGMTRPGGWRKIFG